MRSFLTIALMILSVAAFSFEDEGRGPSAEEREQGKACFEEIKALGCGNPREVGGEVFKKCMEEKASTLSETCQAFHQKMKERGPRPRGPRPDRSQESESQD